MGADNWREAAYRLDRRTKAEVVYSLIAPEAKEIGIVTIPAGNPFSRPEQVTNNITDISEPIATFEPNHWKLDGSFVLPLPPGQSNMEVGWWGAEMSDENGLLQNAPVIEVVFPIVQNVKRFGIAFDAPGGTYCTDLEFTIYGSLGDVLYNERISNSSVYAATREGVSNAYRVVIKLYAMNKPFRYPRVSELDFGVIIRFTNDDIISLNLVTEANPKGASFPLSQLSLTVYNNGEFDQLDPQSNAQFLYARQAFEYRHGLILPDGSTEWAYMGAYYLKDWDVSDNSVSFTSRGKAGVIENYTYFNSSLQEFTIGELIRRILDEVGMQYYIAPHLDVSPVVTGWFGKKNYRAVLANLAELSCCLCYENQHNTIEFTDISNGLEPITSLDYEATFSRKAKLETYYNGINLREYTVRQTTPEVQFDSVEIFYPAPWHDPNESDYPYSVDLPCMVRTDNFPAFREWFLTRKFALLHMWLSCDITWRQNPVLQVGDAASVQLNNNGGTLDMAIVRQSIEFNGALRGNTRTVGASAL